MAHARCLPYGRRSRRVPKSVAWASLGGREGSLGVPRSHALPLSGAEARLSGTVLACGNSRSRRKVSVMARGTSPFVTATANSCLLRRPATGDKPGDEERKL